jgi:hypothetical protein
LDEDELNQLRNFVKERRKQYHEQAAMYNKARESVGTRPGTAGKRKVLNKREKRRLRALGGAKPGAGMPTTPVQKSRAGPTRSALLTAKSRDLEDEAFGSQPQEPASLITQTLFRTAENQVQSMRTEAAAALGDSCDECTEVVSR